MVQREDTIWAMERPTVGGPAKRLPAPAMAAKEREQAGPGVFI